MTISYGVASLVLRSKKEAREEAIRIAISEVILKTAESLTSRLQTGKKNAIINHLNKKITENPYSLTSRFKVIDEHEDMVMDEVWVSVEVEVNEKLLKTIIQSKVG